MAPAAETRWGPLHSGRLPRLARAALTVAAALAVVGCSGVAPAPAGFADEPMLLATDGPAPEERPAAPAAKEGSPELSEEILYKLLVAEFAGRRNRLDLALDNYLDVARATRDPAVIERAVRIAVFSRQQERGLEAARLWTEVAPDNLDARQVYAALLIRAGELDQAVDQLEALLARLERSPEEGFSLVGDMLSREKDHQAVLEVMERLVEGRRDDPRALFAFAQVSARVDELEQAAELLKRVLALEPENTRAAIFRAQVLHRQGKTSEAVTFMRDTVGARPEDYQLRMTYARLLVDAKRYEEAREQFERLAGDRPEDAEVRFGLGLLLLQTNRLERAQAQFEHLLELGERTRTAHFYLGQIAESMDDDEAALSHYERVDGGEHYMDSQVRAAVLLADEEGLAVAREHLRSLPQRSVNEAVRIYQAEAELLSRHDRLEEAMTVYNEALGKHPGNSDLLYGRAMLAEKMDRLNILERDLRRIIEDEPNNADALNALGYTLADRTTRYEEAYELIKRALELKPDNHYIVDSMGWVLYRMGRHREALEHLRRALKLQYDPEIAAHLGEVLWVTGDREGARQVWDQALENTPEDEHLREVIERFNP